MSEAIRRQDDDGTFYRPDRHLVLIDAGLPNTRSKQREMQIINRASPLTIGKMSESILVIVGPSPQNINIPPPC